MENRESTPTAGNRPDLSGAVLYGIADLGYVSEENVIQATHGLLAGGADILQLRGKGHDLQTIHRIALQLIPLCKQAGVPFILNDFPELAAEIGADGVHIGQDDGSLASAREMIGQGKIIGRSTHSLDQARAALAEGFDYIGFGPIFPTPTKKGRPAIGLQDIEGMEAEVGQYIPAFCIGGIAPETWPEVLAAGGRRAVVVSALLKAPDIAGETRSMRAAIAGK